jgi:hypothetical protein
MGKTFYGFILIGNPELLSYYRQSGNVILKRVPFSYCLINKVTMSYSFNANDTIML